LAFAVFDTETTGFNFATNDRIIEIAVVLLDDNLEFEREFTWLVNAKRDVGRTDIHGIRPGWLIEAPSFMEIAPTIATVLSHRIIVGHNVSFDRNFLISEFARLGVQIEISPEAWLDTMRLAKDFVRGQSGNSLGALCELFGITNVHAHSALSDTYATAELLQKIVALKPGLLEALNSEFIPQTWPTFESSGVFPSHPRPQVAEPSSRSLVQVLFESLPDHGYGREPSEYIEALSRALADGVVTDQEVAGLVEVAKFVGLGVEDLKSIHQRFFDDIFKLVWADGILTGDEIALLREAGRVLGVSELDVEESIHNQSATQSRPFGEGANVCLTGSMDPDKATIGSLLSSFGIVITDGVSKKTAAVVAADRDSLSGKANKARQYGIPIYTSTDIWRIYSE
jgi:DNA polymerase-3 subunit epsilon